MVTQGSGIGKKCQKSVLRISCDATLEQSIEEYGEQTGIDYRNRRGKSLQEAFSGFVDLRDFMRKLCDPGVRQTLGERLADIAAKSTVLKNCTKKWLLSCFIDKTTITGAVSPCCLWPGYALDYRQKISDRIRYGHVAYSRNSRKKIEEAMAYHNDGAPGMAPIFSAR